MKLFNIPQAFAVDPDAVIGTIQVPKGVEKFNFTSGGPGGGIIGIVKFISNMITAIIIIGGILILINIALAAFAYITSGGKTDANVKVRDRFTMSIIGLLLMIIAYTIAALIGLIFYGDASFILTPYISGL